MKLSCHCEVKEFQNLETVYLTFCKKKQRNVSERSKLGHDNYNYYFHFEITGDPCNLIGSQQ